jgi:L-asparagine permease
MAMNGSATAFTANWNLVALVVIVPALVGGWYAVRGRVLEMARERVGITGNYPVIAETPLMDEFLEKDAKDTL